MRLPADGRTWGENRAQETRWAAVGNVRQLNEKARCTASEMTPLSVGSPLALENYNLLHRLWREDVVDWQGKYRTALQGAMRVHES